MTGIDLNLDPTEWQQRMLDILGWAPVDIDREFQGGRLLMTSLIKHITNLLLITDASCEVDIQQRVYLYLLWITSGNKVKLMYLNLLADLSKVGQYAWGVATLAILYQYLCRTSQKGIRVIGGFLPLLQVWIYERILPLKPRRDPNLLVNKWLISILPGPPCARVWSNGLCHDTEEPYLLYLFCDQLDLLIEHQFVWKPYSPDVFSKLLDYCVNSSSVWRASVPIIAWDAVEWHYPDRVLRQFGLI
ncbi:hypothetical protein P3S68_011275 [Capsicum galapagoense]